MTKLHTITSRGTSVTIDVDSLSPAIIEKLVAHGLTQKIGDSAASALADAGFKGQKFDDLSPEDQTKVQALAESAMAEVRDTLLSGEWGVERTGSSGVSEETRAIRTVMRPSFKAQWVVANSADAWKGLDEADINAALDQAYAGLDDDTRELVDGMASAKRDEWTAARNAKKAAPKLSFDLSGLKAAK